MTTLTLTSYGAAECVAGSKHLLQIDNQKILVDIGHEYKDVRPDFEFDPKSLDALIITHAHADHMGRLFDLERRGFNGTIYCHAATRDLCRVQLEGELIGARFRNGGRMSGYEITAAKRAINDLLRKTTSFPYEQEHPISPCATRTTLDAGHIIGSEQNILVVDKSISIGFSGDLGRTDVDTPMTCPPGKLPKHLDFYVLEGTYGAKRHQETTNVKEELAEWIEKAYATRGKLVFPAFSMQRTQNILIYLFQLYQEDKIPKDMPIYFDSPSAQKINGVMLFHKECFDLDAKQIFSDATYHPFHFPQLRYVRSKADSISLPAKPGAGIIITASGMCHGGRVENYLDDILASKRNFLVLTGYQAPGTPGYQLEKGVDEISFKGRKIPVKATIGRIRGFSGHSDCDESIKHIKESNDPAKGEDFKGIFLVHGEKQELQDLKQELHNAGYKKVIVVEHGKAYDLGSML